MVSLGIALCLKLYVYLFFFSFFFICMKAKGSSLTVDSTMKRKKKTGLFSLQAKKISTWQFWTPRCLLSSPSFPVLRCRNLLDCCSCSIEACFPEAMSVAVKLGNGHWICCSPTEWFLSISVTSGLDCLLQISDISFTGLHPLATLRSRLVGQNHAWERTLLWTCFLFRLTVS